MQGGNRERDYQGGQRDGHPQGPDDGGVGLFEEVRPCHHKALFFVILHVFFRNIV